MCPYLLPAKFDAQRYFLIVAGVDSETPPESLRERVKLVLLATSGF
jgi:hypothetical protein